MPTPDQTTAPIAEPENTIANDSVAIPYGPVVLDSSTVPTVIRTEQQQIHSGPIPAPDVLQGYNDIVPDAAERIIQMAEKQQAHRIKMETDVLAAQINEDIRRHGEVNTGQTNGIIATIFAFSLSGFAFYLGHQASATIIVGVTLVGLVTVFVTGRTPEPAEKAEDVKNDTPPKE